LGEEGKIIEPRGPGEDHSKFLVYGDLSGE